MVITCVPIANSPVAHGGITSGVGGSKRFEEHHRRARVMKSNLFQKVDHLCCGWSKGANSLQSIMAAPSSPSRWQVAAVLVLCVGIEMVRVAGAQTTGCGAGAYGTGWGVSVAQADCTSWNTYGARSLAECKSACASNPKGYACMGIAYGGYAAECDLCLSGPRYSPDDCPEWPESVDFVC